MRIPYRWLREFVDTTAGPRDVAERLTMAGLETTLVGAGASELSGLVVAEVLAVAPHPTAEALRVCEVSTGGERYRVVCGAPNVRPGVRAAFAPPGAGLPGGRRVAVATIRGTASEGMLCSEAELGVGEDGSGILLLGADAPVGGDLVGHLGLDDAILEVDATPNRPDCLSVVGVAREVAALTGGRLRPVDCSVRESSSVTTAGWRVTIEDPELCPRYAARLIVDVVVGPSPAWLAQRLRAVGLRPINNVVDVTNYVLWELGHPLHAFDGDLLTDRHVVIRRARAGEAVLTLDGQSRVLSDAMLVIADAARAVAVAGVMGGANSEVRGSTRTVLLESAYFAPASIRRTAKALGLSTEASYRFERGADIEGLRHALDRAARLIGELAAGQVASGVLDAYPAPRRPLAVPLRLDRIQRVVGACPPRAVVAEILRGLGFPATEREGGFEVVVPAFRRDVLIEDDLVEEVARVWGYEKIPSTLPSGALALTRRPRHMVAQDTRAARAHRRRVAGSRLPVADRPGTPPPPGALAGRPPGCRPPESARGGSVGAPPDAPVRAAGGARYERAPPDARRGALRDRPRVRGPRRRRIAPGGNAGRDRAHRPSRAARVVRDPRSGRRRSTRRERSKGSSRRWGAGTSTLDRRRYRTWRTAAPRRSWSRALGWEAWASSTPTSRRPLSCPRRSTSPSCRSTPSKRFRAA